MKRLLTIIGGLASIASLAFAGVWAWDAELVQNALPQPTVAQPVKIKVYGPAECLRGSEYFFHVDVEGPGGVPQWDLVPPTNNALTVFPGGRKARFMSLDEGTFSIQVAVAGEALQVDADHIEFENLTVTEPAPQPTPEEIAAIAALSAPKPAPEVRVSDLVHEALAHVDSEDVDGEARAVAGCIRSVVGRIQTGLLPPATDTVGEVRAQVELALGAKADDWDQFLTDLESIVALLREEGRVTTAASAVPTLAEMATALTQ